MSLKVSDRNCFILVFLLFSTVWGLFGQGDINLRKGWSVISSDEIGIMVPDSALYSGKRGTQCDLPSTVMNALYQAGEYPDLYFADNLKKVDCSQFEVPWWYLLEFDTDTLLSENGFQSFDGLKFRLNFEGINYSADLFLNGKQIAGRDEVRNAFRRFSFSIDKHLNKGVNQLAVLVYPPQDADFTIGYVDWNPTPPDLNMGIWRDVSISVSREAELSDLFVQTHLRSTGDQLSADLTISAWVKNNETVPLQGELKGVINTPSGEIQFKRDVAVDSASDLTISITSKELSQLIIEDPELWWPNGMNGVSGMEQPLYRLTLELIVNGKSSDTLSTVFGIREVEDYLTDDGFRGYRINGRDLLIKGGGWVDDLLSGDSREKVFAQVRYTAEMNMNCIRLEGFWGRDPSLYEACDRYGILLMAGWSCHWEWEQFLGKPVGQYLGITEPDEIALMSDALGDQVRWLRNHPSLFVWMTGSDKISSPEAEQSFREVLAEVDPTRPIQISAKEFTSEISGPSGMKMRGPYSYTVPSYWYLDEKRGGAFGFNSETGPGAQVPPLDSLKKMLPYKSLKWKKGSPRDNDLWDYHSGRITFDSLDRYDHGLKRRYGKMNNVNEYAQWAQVMNYELMRPQFEAFQANRLKTKDRRATGVVQWMLNSAWPEFFWQLYDWYLNPTGAYFGAMAGCDPLHLIYRYGINDILLVNETLSDYSDLQTEWTLYDDKSTILLSEKSELSMGAEQNLNIAKLPDLSKLGADIYFLNLILKDSDGAVISRNFYWLSAKEERNSFGVGNWHLTPVRKWADFKPLRNLPRVALYQDYKIELIADEKGGVESGQSRVTLTLENRTDRISFFNEISLNDRESGDRILPVFWSDNYISLMPGEKRAIIGEFKSDGKEFNQFHLIVSGANLIQTLPVESELEISKDGYVKNIKPNRFSLMTYNVAGLPGIVSQSRPGIYSWKIGEKINPYDIVVVQEDFCYHNQLSKKAEHPYQSIPSKEKVFVNDGLNRFSQFPIITHAREAWRQSFGKLDNGSDELAAKGVSFGRHQLADGILVDIYNLHADAGSSQEDWIVKADQIEQLIEFVNRNSQDTDIPVIVAGDFNLRQTDKRAAVLLKRLEEGLGLTDCRYLSNDITSDRIDKIYFRNGSKVKLNPLFYSDDAANFRRFFSPRGYPLSDHSPVTVIFEWE